MNRYPNSSRLRDRPDVVRPRNALFGERRARVRAGVLATLVLAALLASGCGPSVGPASVGSQSVRSTSDPDLVAVPTQEPVAPGSTSGPCPASLARGELLRSAEWGLALRDEDFGVTRVVIWPFGYVAERDGGRLVLRAADGTVVARTGDRLHIEGGIVPGEAFLACGDIRVLDD